MRLSILLPCFLAALCFCGCTINTMGTGLTGDDEDAGSDSDPNLDASPDTSSPEIDAAIDSSADTTDSAADTTHDTFADSAHDTTTDPQTDPVADTVHDTLHDTTPDTSDAPIDVTPDANKCGNGTIDDGEDCDGTNLGSSSCSDQGWTGGTLTCTSSCKFNKAACLDYPSDWLDPGFLHRRQLTIPSGRVAAQQNSFPVLVVSPLKDLSDIKTDCSDVAFTDDSGTALNFEVESCNSTSGLVAWVKMTSIPKSSDTVFYMYYGNTLHTSNDPHQTWSANFSAVWHLGETTTASSQLDLTDSAGNSHTAHSGGNTQVTGNIGFAQSFDGKSKLTIDGSDTLSFGDSDFTISAWIKTSSKEKGCLFSKAQSSGDDAANSTLLGFNQVSSAVTVVQSWVSTFDGAANVVDNQWHQIAWVQNKDSSGTTDKWRIFVDGAIDKESTADTKPDPANFVVRIGQAIKNSTFNKNYTGYIDELRFSTTDRTPNWLKAEYDSQKDPTAFVTYGAEESGKH
jgi:hypothetical protein